jgi:hypothetical protein
MASLRQLKLTLALLALAQLGWLVYVISRTSAKPEPPPAVAAARTPVKRATQVAAAHTPPPLPPPPPPPLPPAVDPPPSALEQRVLGVCGTAGQTAYSSAHAAWSKDGRTARALVFEVRGTSGGLADRLTGMMTALLLAILTDRAFQLDWPEHTTALRTPHIDVTGLLPALGRAPPAEVRRVTWINGDRLKLAELTSTDELDRLWPERVVRMQSNRGFTQALLAHHAAAAARRQLSPNSTQFGCLLNFLLAPTPATLSPYAALVARLADAANQAPVVGVHVRTGDRAFDGAARLQAQGAEERAEAGAEERAELERAENTLYESHRFIIDFALARTAAHSPHSPHPPRLLLLSDSAAFRRAAARQLGEVVLNPYL